MPQIVTFAGSDRFPATGILPDGAFGDRPPTSAPLARSLLLNTPAEALETQ
jgi:hypothetical protein